MDLRYLVALAGLLHVACLLYETFHFATSRGMAGRLLSREHWTMAPSISGGLFFVTSIVLLVVVLLHDTREAKLVLLLMLLLLGICCEFARSWWFCRTADRELPKRRLFTPTCCILVASSFVLGAIGVLFPNIAPILWPVSVGIVRLSLPFLLWGFAGSSVWNFWRLIPIQFTVVVIMSIFGYIWRQDPEMASFNQVVVTLTPVDLPVTFFLRAYRTPLFPEGSLLIQHSSHRTIDRSGQEFLLSPPVIPLD